MLTDEAIAALPAKGKAYKVADGGGLFVLVTPAGCRSLRLKYRLGGREYLAVVGRHPEMGIEEARQEAAGVKRYVADTKQAFKSNPPKRVARKIADVPAAMPDGGAPDSFIYFIESPCGHIKIGYSVNPEQRLQELQCGNPHKLRIIRFMPGGPERENWIHKRFRQHRAEGEWFRINPALRKFMIESAIPWL